MFYAIRHKPSGVLLPVVKNGLRCGTTYIDLPFKGMPRLFPSEVAAKHCLRWWLAGEAVPEYDDDEFGTCKIGASMGKGKAGRNAEDMEIVAVAIIPLGGSKCSTKSSQQMSKSTSSILRPAAPIT